MNFVNNSNGTIESHPRSEQMERIYDYVVEMTMYCHRSADDSRLKLARLLGLEKNFLKLGNVWNFLDLDDAHKELLFTELGTIKVYGKPVTVSIAPAGADYDLRIDW